MGDLSSIPGLGRFPGEGKGYPLQYSGLENSMGGIVHGVANSRTRLSDFHFHSPEPPVVQRVKDTASQIFFLIFCIGVKRIYNVTLVSDVQQSDLAVCIIDFIRLSSCVRQGGG